MTDKHVWFASYVATVVEQWKKTHTLSLISGGNRLLLEECVEKALIHDKSLLLHLRTLLKLLPNKTEYPRLEWDRMLQENVCQNGISVMNDSELAHFVINPLLMIHISNEIDRLSPFHWANVKEKLDVPRYGMKRKPQLQKEKV